MITVLAGGVGAARYLSGLLAVVDPSAVTAIVNTADDTVLHGLSISPDLDTVTYTLSGEIDGERGWGLAGETWTTMGELARFAEHRPHGSMAGGTWFNLGDRDMATHLYRTGRRAEGASLSTITAEITAAFGLRLRLLPVTDDRLATVVTVPGEGDLSFQEYFVGRRHSVPVSAVRFEGAESARPADGVLDALAGADVVVISPSNPIVSIGPVRAVAGVDTALSVRRDSVVAVSPIVAGAALKGPADRLLAELGYEPSVVGVARIYAPVCGTLVVDHADAALAPAVEREGIRCVVTATVMSTPAIAADLGRTTLEVARR